MHDHGALVFQASVEAAHANLSRFEVGAPIHGETPRTGEPVTIRVNALEPYGVMSYRFDGDGVAGQDLLVVEDGKLVARPARQRYAQYLGLPVTGRPGMVQVPPGRTPAGGLIQGDEAAYEVLAFSAPNVDVVTGDFGMEIRVGYEHRPGSEPRPISGGSLTGNLFAALAGVHFSRETHQRVSYSGPVAIRFDSLQVAGAHEA